MFRHVVLFRWTAEATDEQKQTVQDRLSGLPGLIPEIKSYSMGTDVGLNPGAYDFAVVADFADKDAYLVYRDQPDHRAIITQHITPIVAERAALQYQT